MDVDEHETRDRSIRSILSMKQYWSGTGDVRQKEQGVVSDEVAVQQVKEDPLGPKAKKREFQRETEGWVSVKVLKPGWAMRIKRMKRKSTGLQCGEKEEKQGTVAGEKSKLSKRITKLCLSLCNPLDCSLPGSSAHGISQARILERVDTASSRGSARPRDRTCVSCIAGGFFTHLNHQGRF